MFSKIKKQITRYRACCVEAETGVEIIEFVFVFPIICFTVFTTLDIGWALYQKITFDYAMAAVSWNLEPISDEVLDGMDDDGQALIIAEYLAEASPDIIFDKESFLAHEMDDKNHLLIKAEGSKPIISNAVYTETKDTDQYDREVLGFGTKKYTHSYILIHCQYQYKIDWLLNFGDFFGVDSWSYNTGIIDVARTTGKDFYFTS